MSWTGAINAQVCAMKSHRNFSQLTYLIPLIGILTHVLVRFIVFGCILDCFVTAWNSVQTSWTGAINAKVCATNSHRIFLQRIDPINPIGPKTLVLVHFRSVSVHLAMFHYYMDLGAKWVELVQLMDKFVPLSRIGVFATNAPDPPHMTPNSSIDLFRTVWVHFGFVSFLHETRCKTGWTSAINEEVCATKSHNSFSQWTHPIHPIGR